MSKKDKIAPERGEIYSVPRTSKPAQLIQIERVINKAGHTPKVSYQAISKSGKLTKRIMYSKEDKKTERVTRKELKREQWLQWRDRAWRLPEAWELVT